MVPSPELLLGLSRNRPVGMDYYIHLNKELTRIRDIRRALAAITEAKAKAKEEFIRQLTKLDEDTQLIIKLCNHEEEKYYADPAGGSDSHHECVICGRTRR